MGNNYLDAYAPLLVHILLAGALAGGIILISGLVGTHRRSLTKMSPYECGMTPLGTARERFSVKFYLVAMLFILFDVEAVFLYPWAVIYRELRIFGFAEMFLYIAIILAGFVYIWKKGALDWNQ